MIIPCSNIVKALDACLFEEFTKLNKLGIKSKLVDILLGMEPEQKSFVAIKSKKAQILNVGFELVQYSISPIFKNFISNLIKIANDQSVSGVIIQHPIPTSYSYNMMYDKLPAFKEIEGHKKNSEFYFPLSLAVLSGLKYIYASDKSDLSRMIIDLPFDKTFLNEVLRNKNIVIAGKGSTGGAPIGKTFKSLDIPFDVVDQSTPNPNNIFKQADIIITATGKKIINKDNIKPGVVLINVGLRKENGRLRGDFDESEIANIASWHNITPNGFGPLDVSFLFKNLLTASKMQILNQ